MFKIKIGDPWCSMTVRYTEINHCLHQEDALVVHRLLSLVKYNNRIAQQRVMGVDYRVELMA